ncbi:SDR family NAD(P)-dependent oxidoreductase [Noviherbaspirillum denitrificans]|uniref:Short-chain dehydrogenase n=1 Tax=Noviherbaspirillum denitrificans TaxID=1968433 RepID=A0A254TA87_9BURK|nr:glucose 1-dehydrogenase [Noviherbaspirillum denitrificans]OWW19544.1 short-chain dehydrogenase [Noviherbaspirillum denitrificans]
MSAAGNTTRVLVTGATGGIGRATCVELIRQAKSEGKAVSIAAVASRSGAALEALTAELNSLGARAIGLHANLADAASCVQLIDDATAFCGGLDALVSNAGITRPAPLADQTVEDWDTVFSVNTRATWLLARAARKALAESRGAIVAVASMSGMYPHPGYGAYSASKAALLMLCRQLAQEWAADGIRVNTVSPGMIRTPLTERVYQNEEVAARREAMVPLGRIGRPEDIARAVAYLLGDHAAYVTGENLRVDGGLCDRFLGTIPGVARA